MMYGQPAPRFSAVHNLKISLVSKLLEVNINRGLLGHCASSTCDFNELNPSRKQVGSSCNSILRAKPANPSRGSEMSRLADRRLASTATARTVGDGLRRGTCPKRMDSVTACVRGRQLLGTNASSSRCQRK